MTTSATPQQVPQWQQDLERVGLIRRALQARKWYGADWWFVAASAVLLLFVIIVGVAPQLFAPYDPRAEVGPSLLAPGEVPMDYVLLARTDRGVTSLRDVGTSKHKVGFVLASPASQALREALDQLNAEGSVRYQPRPQRYETLAEGLEALQKGEIDAFVAAAEEVSAEGTLVPYPDVEVVGPLRQSAGKGFTLGTNQLGQDVLSRIIWGTRIASSWG